MNTSRLPFYELEFSRPGDFWEGDGTAGRCVFLMPVTPSSEFLAFGVLEAQVRFVARGRLAHELSAFLDAMSLASARIELYVQAPVPRSILKRYVSSPPIEHHEAEEPPAPPVRGFAPSPTVLLLDSSNGPLWTSAATSERRVILSPTHLPAEFLAVGLASPSGPELFQFRGLVQEQLGTFVAHVVHDRARVELLPRPSAV